MFQPTVSNQVEFLSHVLERYLEEKEDTEEEHKEEDKYAENENIYFGLWGEVSLKLLEYHEGYRKQWGNNQNPRCQAFQERGWALFPVGLERYSW